MSGLEQSAPNNSKESFNLDAATTSPVQDAPEFFMRRLQYGMPRTRRYIFNTLTVVSLVE